MDKIIDITKSKFYNYCVLNKNNNIKDKEFSLQENNNHLNIRVYANTINNEKDIGFIIMVDKRYGNSLCNHPFCYLNKNDISEDGLSIGNIVPNNKFVINLLNLISQDEIQNFGHIDPLCNLGRLIFSLNLLSQKNNYFTKDYENFDLVNTDLTINIKNSDFYNYVEKHKKNTIINKQMQISIPKNKFNIRIYSNTFDYGSYIGYIIKVDKNKKEMGSKVYNHPFYFLDDHDIYNDGLDTGNIIPDNNFTRELLDLICQNNEQDFGYNNKILSIAILIRILNLFWD
ncbi:Hypothetical protein KVN_LOCUS125 [uncultured virus]|nr:Hypothetical protein KVN_LOCUS125 [uncultured virus]